MCFVISNAKIDESTSFIACLKRLLFAYMPVGCNNQLSDSTVNLQKLFVAANQSDQQAAALVLSVHPTNRPSMGVMHEHVLDDQALQASKHFKMTVRYQRSIVQGEKRGPGQ